MVKAYNSFYVDVVQDKLANMFELACVHAKMDADKFAQKFTTSILARAFEIADPIWVLGKSANELVTMITGKDMSKVEQKSAATPEFWVGWVYAYAQWELNVKFSVLFDAIKPSELVMLYFPYHEMDIEKTVELIEGRLPKKNVLKEKRLALGLTQMDLARLSDVSIRNIKAYEQGANDISKASGETLWALAKVLGCSIEELIE